jgi:DNA helicase-4
MMLAFNRKAANEMRERLLRLLYPKVIPEFEKYKREYRAKMHSDQINEVSIVWDALIQLSKIHDIPLPFIMTFHGLVHNIVNPSEQLIVDTSDPEGAIQSKVLQKLIDNHIRDYNIFGSSLRQLMMSLLDNGWDEIGKISYGFSRKEYIDYRRSIINIALKGHHVKSFGEKKIADYMFLHNVKYSYEHSITINQKRYKPDFMLKIDNKIIVIEYVGLVGMSHYDELLEQKRHAYGSQPNLVYIELTRDDVRDEQRFEHRMNTIFHQHDIEMRQLNNDEIWDLVKERAVDLFTRLMHNFIQKCRQLQISPDELRQRISTMITNNLEGEFANVACTFYQEYIDYCVDNNVIDFSTLMQRATQLIRDGKSDFSKRHSHGNITQIRFLSIDEFQDFSVLFYELLLAMRGINPTMQLFCVGDDWQAINRFAGADTRFFTDFERYIGPRTVCHITSNYRSAQQIVDFGNAVMYGRGVPAKAAKLQSGQVFVVYLDDFIGNSKEGEYFGWNNTQLTALSRLINIHVAKKQHVTVLSRASAPLDESLKKIRQLIDTKNSPNIMHSTTHGYKGLEQGSIILWDVTERQYPMVHSHWIFGRILGDTLEQIIEDERRLFYVGVTRASKSLFIMTRRQSMSQFLAEVMDISTVTEIDISTLSPMASLRSDLMILQLTGGTFAVKDAIKQHDYRWSSSTSGWRKQVRVAEFSASTLLRESWVAKANNITVTLIDETGAVLRTYLVNAGRMSKQS